MEGTSSSGEALDLVDDFYFSALHDEEVFPISDEKYAQELQLQEALMSSAISSITPKISTQPSNREEDVETPMKKQKGKEKETGQSSETFCLICMDIKSTQEMFTNSGCNHSFCTDCIGTYVGTKIQENISMVKCPDVKCKEVLEPQSCRSIIPKEVFDRWENALCESLVLGSQKFYCPFKDCSALLVDDGGEVVTVSECPNCRRLFCAQCKVAWHAGIDCGEFQNLNENEREKEDIMVMELAKKKNWRRCPRCNFFVEKTDGCLHITCRCGLEFCYGCGSYWRHSQFSSHVCSTA
ncbi:PREDICTED: E3 ubiquitin-ligase [Prunus dulcis]|uniref:RBR-type E3 ubiquitin transferase n=1 Tax=Prunus dulcis TaxID=3755 RepID=A0A5E4F1X3_PRUDU|nr:probable E3 ubiquitin-protein ligase RNF217 [Prunus dulcis]KAI5336643.1 hypothetical protein L3X38_015911 [Prunus dulcis]VVA20651.1 PREDICTED: E3 ubiquitin-ligase [Prunus dulcis]